MTNRNGRREFLKGSAALGLAAGAVPVVNAQETRNRLALSAYGERSLYVKSVRISDGHENCSFASDCNTLTPLQDTYGIITPSALHFSSAHGAYPPDINPDEFEFFVHGMVDRPLKFSLAELKRLPFVSRIMYIECEANYPAPEDTTVQHTHGKVSCSEWTGVPVELVLKECGIQSGAKWVICEGLDRDRHSKSIPLASLMKGALLAYGQNGEPLRPHQGFPLRIVVPGAGGFSNVKWIHRMRLADKPYLTPFERFSELYAPKSVITYPSGGQQLEGKGFYAISGIAWSGRGAIKTVDVSTDGGKNWKEAKLESPVLPAAFTRFSLDWNWNGNESILMSRARDDQGNVQPSPEEVAKELNASLEDVKTNKVRSPVTQWNMIFPWRVAQDGGVHNALYT